MSDNYTHKFILFTEKNFKGNAKVVMHLQWRNAPPNWLNENFAFQSLIIDKGNININGVTFNEGPYEEQAGDLGSIQTLPPGEPNYRIKFFPRTNRFTITPAPPSEKGDGDFRWIFKDRDLIAVEWDTGYEEDIKYPCLEFGRHSLSDRPSPIEVSNGQDPDHWVAPPFSYALKKQGEIVRLRMNNDGAAWYFNFCCTIDGKEYRVDPEMQMGTGTGRRF